MITLGRALRLALDWIEAVAVEPTAPEAAIGRIAASDIVAPVGEGTAPGARSAGHAAVLLGWGEEVTPAAARVMASAGITHLDVFRKPRVGVLVLVGRVPAFPGSPAGERWAPLLDALRRWGGDIVATATVGDGSPALADEIDAMLAQDVDLLVLVAPGTASARAQIECALTPRFTRAKLPPVAVAPGVLVGGAAAETAIIAVAGTAAECSALLAVLVRPMLRKLSGYRRFRPRPLPVRLLQAAWGPTTVWRLIWARFGGGGTARPLDGSNPGLRAFPAKADALLVLRPSRLPYSVHQFAWALPVAEAGEAAWLSEEEQGAALAGRHDFCCDPPGPRVLAIAGHHEGDRRAFVADFVRECHRLGWRAACIGREALVSD
ncbi:MAG TPA: hypothetical protein VIL95_06335, partial [Bacillota bacterium]